MISIIQDKFEHDIADKITRFLEHPTAHMIKELKRYTDLLTFDTHNDWHKWQSVERITKLAGNCRGYVTYDTGGQQGGVARVRDSDPEPLSMSWYVWNQGRRLYVHSQRIPAELVLVERSEDGYQAIKLVLEGSYELKDGEHYLDDFEDMALENEAAEESERGVRNDDDDDNSEGWEGREDDSETEAEHEMEDEADDVQAMINNERREEIEQLNQERRQEIASLTRELEDNNHTSYQQSTLDGVMTLNYVIHASQLRIAELKNQIALSRR